MSFRSLLKINYSEIYAGDGIVFCQSGANIDADGSPFAYHPVSDKGLDNLANAGRRGQWWGIATDTDHIDGEAGKGTPYIQKEGEPAPGFYVSTTALEDRSKQISDPARYVNSEQVPFIVLPGGHNFGCELGDLVLCYNRANGKQFVGIYADIGPAGQIGEISIAMARLIGVDSSPRLGGCGHGIIYVLFPGHKSNWPAESPGQDAIANELIAKNGGIQLILHTLEYGI
jgi:hypothetical protein